MERQGDKILKKSKTTRRSPHPALGNTAPGSPRPQSQRPQSQVVHTPPVTPRSGVGSQALGVVNSRTTGFSLTRPRQQQPQRTKQDDPPSPFRASVLVSANRMPQHLLAHKHLFNAEPAPLRRDTAPGGGPLFVFGQAALTASLHKDILTLCQHWLDDPLTEADGLALIEAVCAQLPLPALWQQLLEPHAEALAQLWPTQPDKAASAWPGITM